AVQPPGRQLPRRLGRRMALRPHRQLHRHVVDLDRARHPGCNLPLADPRAAGGAPRAAVGAIGYTCAMAITAAVQEQVRAEAGGEALPLTLILAVTAAVAVLGGAAAGFWVLYGGTLTLDLGAIVCF